MTDSMKPLRRLAAAGARHAFCTVSLRLAVIVAIVVAVTTSAHAATPQPMAQDLAACAGGPAKQRATLVATPADVTRVQA